MADFKEICHNDDCGDDNLMHAHLHFKKKIALLYRISQPRLLCTAYSFVSSVSRDAHLDKRMICILSRLL